MSLQKNKLGKASDEENKKKMSNLFVVLMPKLKIVCLCALTSSISQTNYETVNEHTHTNSSIGRRFEHVTNTEINILIWLRMGCEARSCLFFLRRAHKPRSSTFYYFSFYKSYFIRSIRTGLNIVNRAVLCLTCESVILKQTSLNLSPSIELNVFFIVFVSMNVQNPFDE